MGTERIDSRAAFFGWHWHRPQSNGATALLTEPCSDLTISKRELAHLRSRDHGRCLLSVLSCALAPATSDSIARASCSRWPLLSWPAASTSAPTRSHPVSAQRKLTPRSANASAATAIRAAAGARAAPGLRAAKAARRLPIEKARPAQGIPASSKHHAATRLFPALRRRRPLCGSQLSHTSFISVLRRRAIGSPRRIPAARRRVSRRALTARPNWAVRPDL